LSGKKKSNGKSSNENPRGGDQEESHALVPDHDELDEYFLDTPGGEEYAKWQATFSEESRKRIQRRLNALSNSANAVTPIICRGTASTNLCPYSETCPFMREKNPPLGKQCPIEQQIIITKITEYKERFGVDKHNPADLTIIERLTEIELLEYRLRSVTAARYPDMLVKETVGLTPQGHEVSRLAANPALKIRERLSMEKTNLLQQLVGTRREKYKKDAALGQGQAVDYSTNAAALAKMLNEFTERTKRFPEETS